jgi:hypothetical protein
MRQLLLLLLHWLSGGLAAASAAAIAAVAPAAWGLHGLVHLVLAAVMTGAAAALHVGSGCCCMGGSSGTIYPVGIGL